MCLVVQVDLAEDTIESKTATMMEAIDPPDAVVIMNHCDIQDEHSPYDQPRAFHS